MKFAAHQPNFCPWIGYFVKMNAADTLVILDDVQMPTGRSYVTRSKILGNGNGTWLSVSTSKNTGCKINDVRLFSGEGGWRIRHLNLLRDRYRGKKFFDEIYPVIEHGYTFETDIMIDFNMNFIRLISKMLDVQTEILFSSALEIVTTSDQRIADIGKRIGAKTYCSGVGGNSYQSEETFTSQGLSLRIINIQKESDKISNIGYSIIDNLMEVGFECCKRFIRSHDFPDT